jgi:hypothetical protein
LINSFEELVVDISYIIVLGKPLEKLTKIVKQHAEQFLPNSWQHTRNSHVSQLIIWQIQREARAFDLSKPSEKFHGCFIVPLSQGSQIN